MYCKHYTVYSSPNVKSMRVFRNVGMGFMIKIPIIKIYASTLHNANVSAPLI